MALGVKVLYPYNVDETGITASTRFINYNSKYLVTENATVTVTIRIRAASYDNFGETGETLSTSDPIAYMQISNDAEFSTDRTLTLSYVEDRQYDLSPLTGYTGSPTVTNIIAGDDDYGLEIVRITNWVLDSGQGEKKVYIRFITGGATPQYFPATTDVIKGWWDDIVVVKEPPSVPTIMTVDNETSNHYVGKETVLSWIEANDNISGLRGYNLDIELTDETEIIEECDDLTDFQISDMYTIAYNIANDLPVMHTRYSSSYGAGEYTFAKVAGESKVVATFTKTGATAHGQELQFENLLTTDEHEQDNYVLEANLKPSTITGANGVQYLAIQNFAATYTDAYSLSGLDAIIDVDAEDGSAPYYDISALDAEIIVDAEDGSAPYYDLGALSATIYVAPERNTEPIYVDMANVHTNINSWFGNGADFILFEIEEDGTYSYVRPTWGASEALTGFTRTTLSTAAFAEDISPNNIFQDVELVYRENRNDIKIDDVSSFGWYDVLDIADTSEIWEPESFSILWQKIRMTKELMSLNKIQLMINSDETRDRLVWFSLYIVQDGADVTGGITGLPFFYDNTSETNRKSNYAGISTSGASVWRSCIWDTGDTYPQYNGSYYTRWNETVLLTPGKNVISFAPSGFTGSSLITQTFTGNKDYWIGLVAVGIKDSSTYTTEASWNFSDYRLNMQWSKLNKPISAMLPETLLMARARTASISSMSWAKEYKATTETTNPAILRLMNTSLTSVYSSFPADINNDYAELVVNWNQDGADSIERLANYHTYDIPKLKGRGRHFLAGFRSDSIPSGQSNTITYNDIRFSDNSLIPNIDLSDNVGYDREILDLDEEDATTVVEQTSWATTDWNRVWSKHYSDDTGATVTIDDNNHLLFAYTADSADSITRAVEAHYLTPTGSNTCEITTRFDMSAYSLDSEFYVAFMPSKYESTIIEVANVDVEGTPDDLIILGFKWNGDIYYYRPDVNTGTVSSELVHTRGVLSAFEWNTNDVKIRIDNGVKPGTTSLTIWHGSTLYYNSDYLRLFLPESDDGFYVAMGMKGIREPENTFSLEVGNFLIREVSSTDYTATVGTALYGESMQDLKDQWFVSPQIEQISSLGGVDSGSWFLAGVTQVVDDTALTKYSVDHREVATYNIAAHSSVNTTFADSETLGPDGLPDYSRLKMYVNIDDITTVPALAEVSRWIGPYFLMNYGLDGVEAGDVYRWDFNYTFYYPDSAGLSEVIVGMSNWLPTNAPATNSGETFTLYQNYAVYSFIEDDLTENTKAMVYAFDDPDTIEVGLTDGQYDSDDPARYAFLSFVSDGSIKYTKGRLTSDGGSIDTAVNIGNRYIPSQGKLSVVIKPKNTPGSLNPVVSLSANYTTVDAGDPVTLSWYSSNATYVDYNNFGITSTDLNGNTIVTPTQSTDYVIRVKNNNGASATATVRVNVNTVAENAPSINSFSVANNPLVIGTSTTLSWNVSNPSTGVMTVVLNGGAFSNQPVSAVSSTTISPVSNTVYTLTATNDQGTASRSLQVTTQTAGTLSVTLEASSLSVTSGTGVVLTYTTTPTTGVILVSSNFGATGINGTKTVYPETTTTYTITVQQSGGEQQTANVTVNVGGYASGVHQLISPIYLGVRNIQYNYLLDIRDGYDNHWDMTSSDVTLGLFPLSNINEGWYYDATFTLNDTVTHEASLTWRKYYWLIPGPWTPGALNTIVSANLVFTTSQDVAVITVPSYIWTGRITSDWNSSTSTLPSVINKTSQTSLTNLNTVGATLNLSNTGIKNMVVDWNNNLEANYGTMLSMSMTSISSMDDDLYYTVEDTSGYDFTVNWAGDGWIGWTGVFHYGSWQTLDDDLSIIPSEIKYATLASPSHPTTVWRPYWSINYQAISGSAVNSSAVRTMNVPVGGAFAEPYQMVSLQSTTDPQYVDLYVYVDDVLYASQEDIPLNANTDDGFRFFVGARRKSPGDQYDTSTTVSKFALTLINQRTQPENDRANDLALWTKTSGILPSNTLFYGRNVDVWQDEDYETDMISGNSLMAQGFYPVNPRLQAVTLKVNATAVGNIVAYLCAADSDDEPTLIPVSNHIEEDNSNILATSWAKVWPGMQEAMFTFNLPVTVTPGNLYYVVFDYLTSAYGSSDSSLMPLSPAYQWSSSGWNSIDSVLAFRVFSDVFVNTINDLHAQRQNGRVSAVNNAGLLSAMTDRTTDVTVDLLAPHKPSETDVAPTLYLKGHDGETYVDNYGALMNLRIGAVDTDVTGAGIQDFRIVYWGNFDELLTTDFYQWNDFNADNYVDVSITYPGIFLDTKKVYAQVRDKVGNVSNTNELYVDFKYAFWEDTEPPYLVRTRMEGDATIDPDPNEAAVTKTVTVNTSLYVLDKWTGCKDFRVNHNYEISSTTGALVYGDYQPYIPNFIESLTGDDGIYAIAIQCRDYGDNATQEYIEHIKTISFEDQTNITELPTAVIKYRPQIQEYLYVATTRRRYRSNLTCVNSSVVGYSAYTLYIPWDGSTRQTFKSTETIVVKVNGITRSSSEYTVDATNDWIVFNTSLTQYDVVTMDIIEEVAVLYRYENSQAVAVKTFDREGERAIGALAVYNNTLYIGTSSGRIYAYNGISTSSSLYRVSDGSSNYLPISTMMTGRFTGEDRDYLYVGTYKSAQLYRYGGNVADTSLTWTRLTTVTSAMSSDLNVFDLQMYNNRLFVATGPYGTVYRYARTYDADGVATEAVTSKQLYEDEFSSDPLFRMDVLCLENYDDKIFAGVDYNASIFSYQYLNQNQPKLSEWTEIYKFNSNFEDSPNPWEFYNNGNVDHNNTEKLEFTETYDTTGILSDWEMQVKGETSEYCLWVNKSTNSTWQSVSNTTGWMIDFEYDTLSYSDIDNSYQGVKVFDGAYELEFRIYANNTVEIVSGTNTETANITSGSSSNKFRIAVQGQDVTIYINDSNTAIIDKTDFLSLTTTGKSIIFGKTDITSPRCYGSWKYLYYYINGTTLPILAVERDFIRDQVIAFGTEVRYLKTLTEIPINSSTHTSESRLIAGVQPRDPSGFVIQDDPSALIPRTYVRSPGDLAIWQFDAKYASDNAAIIDAIVDNNVLISIAEVTDDALNYDPLYIDTFMINNPAVAMTRNGNVYYRRRTQAYDTILKDTHAPLGSIIISENTTAGSVQVYSLEAYNSSDEQITQGYAARYSPLDVEVENANNAIDGNANTYDAIGTSEIRYLQHTFDETNTIAIKTIKWGCKSTKSKTYKVQYLNSGSVWVDLVEMQTDPDNFNIFFDYELDSEINAYAIRIYYTGDAETVQDANNVSLSAHDSGIGVAYYRISSYQDFRDSSSMVGADANGWIPMSDGTITINWNLISSSDNWSIEETFSSPVTAAVVFDDILVVGTLNGRVYISSDGDTFVQSSTLFGSQINTFTEWSSLLYLATDSGSIYQSDNGLDWSLVTTISGIDRIASICVYNDLLYVGTGNSGRLYTYNSDTGVATQIKQFASNVISSLYVNGSNLYIGLYTTGEIFTYDGENFSQVASLDTSKVNKFEVFDSKIFASCANGKIYNYANATSGWTLLFDSSIRNIIGSQVYTNNGPEITSVVEEGAGTLGAGKWRYKVTYINNGGVESSAGESYQFDNTVNQGSLKVTWRVIDNAIGYKLYRCSTVNGVENSERLMVVDSTNDNIITNNYFVDNGNYNVLAGEVIGQDADGEDITEDDIAPPAVASNTMWFAGDYNKVYLYDKQSMSEVDLPSTANGLNGIIQFKGEIYAYGQERPYTDAEVTLLYNQQAIPSINGKFIKYIGTTIGSGYKTVYCQYKDAIDNVSSVLSDRIFYNNLIEKHVIEVDNSSGAIVDSYESTSSPTQKTYSPLKLTEQTAVYESEPFFAANLSRWDVIDLVAQLPYNTDVELYVRTASTRAGLASEDWEGPFELTNPNLEYDYYPGYGYYYFPYYQDYYYTDYSYYLEDEGVIQTLNADISYLTGAWLQFKLVLVTRNKGYSPDVFSILVKYISTNAAMFYTTIFNIETIANNERAQTGDFDISRGILTWNGVIPDGGNIQFGISTQNLDSYDWADYQLITPNQVFEVTEPGEQFRIAAVLTSTDTEVAIIDEWAILFECGDKDVKVNLNQYEGLI